MAPSGYRLFVPRSLARLLVGLALTALVAVSPARAQVSGISYTVAPVGEYVFFDGDAGLEDGFLYGGSVGLGFGEYLHVSGEYLLNPDFTVIDNIRTITSDAAPGEEDVVLRNIDPTFGLQRYGGRIRLNLSTEELIPYASIGAGVLAFDPEDPELPVGDPGGTYRVIYGTGGAGFIYSVGDRTTLTVGGDLMMFRYDPAVLYGLTERDDRTAYNPVLRASLAYYLGGRRPGELTALDRAIQEQFGGGVGGLRFVAEPFYGRLVFNEALGFPDQNLYGVNAGVQFGPYAQLRGFYWRGAPGEELFDEFLGDFEDIALYGGELKLRLASQFIQSITPHLMLGGGYLNTLSDYAEDVPSGPDVVVPMDQYFAMAGAGVVYPLSNSVSLTGNIRGIALSETGTEAEDVTEPGEIFISPLYSFGLEFSFGGREGRTPGDIAAAQAREERAAREALRASATAREQRLQSEIDSLEAALADNREELRARINQLAEQDDLTAAEIRELRQARAELAEQEAAAEERQEERVEERQTAEAPSEGRVDNLSNRTITLPIPEVGEIYIRVGETSEDVSVSSAQPPAAAGGTNVTPIIIPTQPQAQPQPAAAPATQGVTAQEVQQIVRQALREQMAAQGRADSVRALTEAQIQSTVRETIREVIQDDGQVDVSAIQQDRIERLEGEIDDLQRRLEDQLNRAIDRAEDDDDDSQGGGQTTVVTGAGGGGGAGDGRTTVVTEDGTTTTGGGLSDAFGLPLQAYFPYTGARFGEGPTQVQLGVRGDYRREDDAPFRFLPEISLGLGGGGSIAVFANAGYGFGEGFASDQLGSPIKPYAGAGLGIASEDGFDLGIYTNLFVGTEYDIGGSGALFAEYGTFGFFDFNRLLVGYRVDF